MKIRKTIKWFVAILAIFLIWSITFTVDETQYGVVTRFGRPLERVRKPGLHFKWFWPVDRVIRVDKRILNYHVPEESLLTEDLKNLQIFPFVSWKVINPIRFVETLMTISRAEENIKDLTDSQMGIALGKVPFHRIVNIEAGKILLNSISNQLKIRMNKITYENFGVEIVDLQIETFTFPPENRQSIYERMISDRERAATQFRSAGERAALIIESEASAAHERILGKAHGESTRIRGEGEAKALAIFAQAYKQDPQFYDFIRSLESYEAIINKDSTIFIESDSKLLKHFNEPLTSNEEAK